MYRNLSRHIEDKKLVLQLNGVDIEKFDPQKKFDHRLIKNAYSIPQDKSVLSFIGAVEPIKNVKKLVEAFSILIKKYRNKVFLLIVGPYYEYLGNNDIDRSYRTLLKNCYVEINDIITKNNLDNFIRFLGPCSHIEEILAITDIF